MALPQEQFEQLKQSLQGINPEAKKALRNKLQSRISGLITPEPETGLKGFATGVGKGILSTVRGLGRIGETIQKQTFGRLAEAASGGKIKKEEVVGDKFTGGEGTPRLLRTEVTTPQGMAENIGFFTEKVGEFFTPAGLVSKGRATIATTEAPFLLKLLGNIAVETGATTAIGAAQGQTPEELKTTAGTTAAFEAVPGVIGFVARSPIGKPIVRYLSEKIPSRLINSIIRPDKAAFNFGRNPGLGVVEEGITANSRGGLLTNIGRAKTEVGQEIGTTVSQATQQGTRLDVQNAILNPIRAAKKQAMERGESALFQRLDAIEDGYTKLFIEGEKGIETAGTKLLFDLTPEQVHQLKINTGQATRWTGQLFDNDVNQVRVAIYRNLDGLLDETIPGIKDLNQRYANLLTAEKNLERTDKTLQRLNLIGLRQTGVGVGLGFGASLASGDPFSEAVIKGVAVGAGFQVLGTTAVKTRLAQQFFKLSPQNREKVFRVLPILRNILLGIEETNEPPK